MARKAAGYSQVRAAEILKLNPATFTRWESGENGISAYDLMRLVRLYDFDPDLAYDPPASRVEIRRRLGPVAAASREAVRRASLRPLSADERG
jgi:transcriptional regulator with XRE-family HTH domain